MELLWAVHQFCSPSLWTALVSVSEWVSEVSCGETMLCEKVLSVTHTEHMTQWVMRKTTGANKVKPVFFFSFHVCPSYLLIYLFCEWAPHFCYNIIYIKSNVYLDKCSWSFMSQSVPQLHYYIMWCMKDWRVTLKMYSNTTIC